MELSKLGGYAYAYTIILNAIDYWAFFSNLLFMNRERDTIGPNYQTTAITTT